MFFVGDVLFVMMWVPPNTTPLYSSAASDVYKGLVLFKGTLFGLTRRLGADHIRKPSIFVRRLKRRYEGRRRRRRHRSGGDLRSALEVVEMLHEDCLELLIFFLDAIVYLQKCFELRGQTIDRASLSEDQFSIVGRIRMAVLVRLDLEDFLKKIRGRH